MTRDVSLPLALALALALALLLLGGCLAAPSLDTDQDRDFDASQLLEEEMGEDLVEKADINLQLTEFDYQDACTELADARWAWLLEGQPPDGPTEELLWSKEENMASSALGDVQYLKDYTDLEDKVTTGLEPELLENLQYGLHPGDFLLPKELYQQKLNYTRAVRRLWAGLQLPCSESDAATGGCRIPMTVMERVLKKSGDAAQLRHVWNSAMAAARPYAASFASHLALVRDAAALNGFSDAEHDAANATGAGTGAVEAYWEDLQDTDTILELTRDRMRELWEQLRPLHLKLARYVRVRLEAAFGTDAVAPAAPRPEGADDVTLPAHLLGSLTGADWSVLADLVFPDSTLQKIEEAMKEKEFAGSKLFELALDMISNEMGVENVLKSNLLSNIRLDGQCPAKVLPSCLKRPAKALTCKEGGWLNYAEAHDVITRMLYSELGKEGKSRTPLREFTRYSALHDAVPSMIRLLSLHSTRLVQVLPSTNDILSSGIAFNSDEEEEEEEEENEEAGTENGNLLLLSALHIFPRMAYYIASDEWRYQLLQSQNNTTNSSADPSVLWAKIRREYQLIDASQENDSDTSFLADPEIVSNSPLMGPFAAELLQFQMLEELTTYDRENPLEATKDTEKMGELLRMGREHRWSEVVNSIFNINSLRAEPLLNFFAPLDRLLNKLLSGRMQAIAPPKRPSVDLTPPRPPAPLTTPSPTEEVAFRNAPDESSTAQVPAEPDNVASHSINNAAPSPTNAQLEHAANATSVVKEATAPVQSSARTIALAASLTMFVAALAAGAAVGGRRLMRKRKYQRNRRPDAPQAPANAAEQAEEAGVALEDA